MLKPVFQENAAVRDVFLANNITNGTIIIYDTVQNKIIGYNKERAYSEFVPGSIFKMPNSMIALSEGSITNVDELFYEYQGGDVFLPVWTNSMSIKQAFKTSNVPAFQKIARSIGIEKMSNYIVNFNYGNKNIGTIVNRFWLEGPLKISAAEHIDFTYRFLQNQLGLSQENTEKLKEIFFIDNFGDSWKLFGKTGWPRDTSWFVGWIEKNDNRYIFSMNMELTNAQHLPLREQITKQILVQLVSSQ